MNGRTRLHAQAGWLLGWQAASKGCPAVPLDAIPTLFLCQEEVDLASNPAPPSAPCPQAAFPRWAVERPGEIKGRKRGRSVLIPLTPSLPGHPGWL